MEAISGLDKVDVLDCFAGKSLLWTDLPHDGYDAIEMEVGKNPFAIEGDNTRIIPSLDLSRYTVIDLDGYGVPYAQLKELFENRTLMPGTRIIYTVIFSKTRNTSLPPVCKEFNFPRILASHPKLAYPYHDDIWDGMLWNRGIRTTREFTLNDGTAFCKRYGWFIVPDYTID